MDIAKISAGRAPPHDVNVIVETLATRGAGQGVNVDGWRKRMRQQRWSPW